MPHEAALRAYLHGLVASHEIDDLVQESYARLLSTRSLGSGFVVCRRRSAGARVQAQFLMQAPLISTRADERQRLDSACHA